MRRVLEMFLVVGLLLGGSNATQASTVQGEETYALAQRIEKMLRQPAFERAEIGMLVVRRSDGTELFAHDADHVFTPASNQKILTAAAALAHFGPTYRFPTLIYTDAPPDDAGEVETLVLYGNGDPSLTSEDYWRIAADLYRAGLRKVRGDLVLDDSAFDRVHWNPTWNGVSARAYFAPVSAINANYGAFAVAVRPGSAPGAPLRVSLDPPVSLFRVRNQGTSGLPSSRDSLAVIRQSGDDAEVVGVTGNLPVGGEVHTEYRSVVDPVRYAGAVFRMQLEAVGISVVGATRWGIVPPNAHRLAVFDGKSLAEIVRVFMKHSNNLMGEALVKALGRDATGEAGSWENGLPVLRDELAKLGLDLSLLRLVDGSGLSYQNQVSPRALVQVLRAADRSFRFGPEFYSALPIAGGDGTLKKRANGIAGAVRAKTGLLNQVSSLSGYATTHSGDELAFSIIVNGYRRSDYEVRGAIDRVISALVEEGAAPSLPMEIESSEPKTSSGS